MFSLSGEMVLKIFLILGGIGMGVFALLYWGLPWYQSPKNATSRIAEERSADLLARYMRELNQIDVSPRDVSLSAPRLSVVRTGRRDDPLVCLMVNRGGTATRLEVEVPPGVTATVEPNAALKPEETVRILLRGTGAGEMAFRLFYEDAYGLRNERRYRFGTDASTFREDFQG